MDPLGIFVQSFHHKLINYLVRVIVYCVCYTEVVNIHARYVKKMYQGQVEVHKKEYFASLPFRIGNTFVSDYIVFR